MQKLRPIDSKRIKHAHHLVETDASKKETWYVHSVLAQCFLPYRDQKEERDWMQENGNVSLIISANPVRDPRGGLKVLGLPFGVKPRLLMSKIQTEAIRNKSSVIPMENSMSGLMKELGMKVTGGTNGTINGFKNQAARLAACRFRITMSFQDKGGIRQKIQNADFFKDFDLWFEKDPNQRGFWPSEIIFTDKFYENLIEHAIPYNYQALSAIHNNARAIDIFLWLTQRLYRISRNKPLFLSMRTLSEMFGGGIKNLKHFPVEFKRSLLAAQTAYPEAKIEEAEGGYIFKASPPPIPKNKIGHD